MASGRFMKVEIPPCIWRWYRRVRMCEEKRVKIKWVNVAKSLGRCGECVEENTKTV